MYQQKAAQEEVEKWRAQEKDAQEKLDNDSKDLSKVSQKQTVLRQKVEECTNKISELGAIPNPEMISKYMAYTQKNVSRRRVAFFSAVPDEVMHKLSSAVVQRARES